MMYVKSKKLYKNTVKLQKHKYFSNMVSKLNNLCENDPQVYWDTVNNILDKKKKFSNTTISPDDWINHFTQLFQKSYYINMNSLAIQLFKLWRIVKIKINLYSMNLTLGLVQLKLKKLLESLLGARLVGSMAYLMLC